MRPTLIILFLFFCSFCKSQKVMVRVFSETIINNVIFSSSKEDYEIWGDSISVTDFEIGSAVQILAYNDSVLLKFLDGSSSIFKEVIFVPKNTDAYFNLKTIGKGAELREYDDNLIVRNNWGSLTLINHLNIDKYLCGVLEKEAGTRAHLEYYKSQAVICRTYWIKAIENHIGEGYEMCDGVHCQAYKGRSVHDRINEAVRQTHDLIMVDTSGYAITAVFHSNCGGETQSAGNVWLQNRPYLRPIKDEHCGVMPNAKWTKSISIEEWKAYLLTKGFKFDSSIPSSRFEFYQTSRKAYYIMGKDSLLLPHIRRDFNLRSAFFSVLVRNDSIVFDGKGYGHGVGLCQEGAMQMAKKGYSYRQILSKYYFGVIIVSLNKYLEKLEFERTEIMKQFENNSVIR